MNPAGTIVATPAPPGLFLLAVSAGGLLSALLFLWLGWRSHLPVVALFGNGIPTSSLAVTTVLVATPGVGAALLLRCAGMPRWGCRVAAAVISCPIGLLLGVFFGVAMTA